MLAVAVPSFGDPSQLQEATIDTQPSGGGEGGGGRNRPAQWDEPRDLFLLQYLLQASVCLDPSERGPRKRQRKDAAGATRGKQSSNGWFSEEDWDDLRNKFTATFGDSITTQQLKSRRENLKRMLNLVQRLMTRDDVLWDEETQQFRATQETWKDLAALDPRVNLIKNRKLYWLHPANELFTRVAEVSAKQLRPNIGAGLLAPQKANRQQFRLKAADGIHADACFPLEGEQVFKEVPAQYVPSQDPQGGDRLNYRPLQVGMPLQCDPLHVNPGPDAADLDGLLQLPAELHMDGQMPVDDRGNIPQVLPTANDPRNVVPLGGVAGVEDHHALVAKFGPTKKQGSFTKLKPIGMQRVAGNIWQPVKRPRREDCRAKKVEMSAMGSGLAVPKPLQESHGEPLSRALILLQGEDGLSDQEKLRCVDMFIAEERLATAYCALKGSLRLMWLRQRLRM